MWLVRFFSSRHGRHLPAFLCALKAGFGAFLAMDHAVVAMLGAFVSARLANIGAQRANGFGVFAASSHCRSCKRADLSAIHVQRNAPRHHLDVLLLQAGSRAMIAGNNAGVARFNARIKCFMTHVGTPGYVTQKNFLCHHSDRRHRKPYCQFNAELCL